MEIDINFIFSCRFINSDSWRDLNLCEPCSRFLFFRFKQIVLYLEPLVHQTVSVAVK